MDLRSILVSAHSGIRWLVVIFAVIALVRFAVGYARGDKYGEREQQIWTALSMTVRLQFVLGLIVFVWGIASSFGSAWIRIAGEHAFTIIIAIAALEMASARAKRGTDPKQQFMTSLIGVLVAFILIFLGVARVSGWS